MNIMNNSEIYRTLQKIVNAVGADQADNMMQVARLSVGVEKLPDNIIRHAETIAKRNGKNVAILFAHGQSFDVVPAGFVNPECVVMMVSPDGKLDEGPAAQLLPVEKL